MANIEPTWVLGPHKPCYQATYSVKDCNSFEDRVPEDEIYDRQIFEWLLWLQKEERVPGWQLQQWPPGGDMHFNSSPPEQNGRHFPDDILKWIFIYEKIVFWLKFVPKGAINNIPALVQIMAPIRRQAIIWTNADPVHWHIYVASGGDELNPSFLVYILMACRENDAIPCTIECGKVVDTIAGNRIITISIRMVMVFKSFHWNNMLSKVVFSRGWSQHIPMGCVFYKITSGAICPQVSVKSRKIKCACCVYVCAFMCTWGWV